MSKTIRKKKFNFSISQNKVVGQDGVEIFEFERVVFWWTRLKSHNFMHDDNGEKKNSISALDYNLLKMLFNCFLSHRLMSCFKFF